MTTLFWSIFPILLADILNPVLFAFMVYAAGTNRPIVNSCSVLLGHTAAYFFVGILLALGIEKFTARLANPGNIDFGIELLIGLLLLWVALGSRKSTGKRPGENTPPLTVATSFGLGAIVNFVGIPFAVPYFAVLGQIVKSDLSTTGAVSALFMYNAAYALPFAVVPVMVALLGAESRPILERINNFLDRISEFLMPILLALIGLALVADAAVYFSKGSALFR